MRRQTFALLAILACISFLTGCLPGQPNDNDDELTLALASATAATKAWINPTGLSDNLSPNGQDASSPQVAMDDRGNAIIVWVQSDGTKDRIYKSELRNGSWSAPSTLNLSLAGEGNSRCPQVAMDNNGNAIIAWLQKNSAGNSEQIFKSELRNGSWSGPANFATSVNLAGSNVGAPLVAMGDNSDAVIVWVQSDATNDQIYKREYRSGIWSTLTDLTTDHISFDSHQACSPQVAMDDSGNTIIVWSQDDGANNQIYKNEYRSAAWQGAGTLALGHINPAGGNATEPQVAIGNNGYAVIAWTQANNIFKSDYTGGAWHSPGDTTQFINHTSAWPAFSPRVALNAAGAAVIVWNQVDGSHMQVFKSERRNGTWTMPTGPTDNLSPDAQDAYNAQVALDSTGNTVVTWDQGHTANFYQVFKAEYRSGNWTTPTSTLDDHISPDGQQARYPMLAMNATGNAIIVWQQSDGSKNQVFKSEYR